MPDEPDSIMKILYDHQIFQEQKFGGISRYFCEIIERLDKADGMNVDLTVKYSQNEYLKRSGFSAKAEDNPDSYENFFGGDEFKGKWSLYKLRNRLRKPIEPHDVNKRLAIMALQKQDFDIFHPTYYDDYFLPYLGSKPFVLTVYDMIHEIYPEYFNLSDQISKRKCNLAQRASKVIAISNSTKKDLVQFFDIPEKKVEVIHLSNSIDSRLEANTHLTTLPSRFLLFVGSRSAYKNFFFFINSVKSILAADPTLHLVCTGSPFNNNEKAFLEQNGVEVRTHNYSATDAELKLLYQQALVFVFPSLYEGFGLPVLEAFSGGCPTVLSDSGSLPEIGGDGAIYFEPKNSSSLQAAISKALYSEQFRADLIERGNKRLRLFSWEETCSKTESVYREIFNTDRKV